MRWSFILFFGVFFTAYGLVNLYIFVRAGKPSRRDLTSGHSMFPSFLSSPYPLSVGGFSKISGSLGERASRLGGIVLACCNALFLPSLLALDFTRGVNHWLPFLPSHLSAHYAAVKQWTAFGLVGSVGLLLLVGHINALSPKIRTLDLSIPRKNAKVATLNIVLASDIHLGTLVGQKDLTRSLTESTH